MMLSGKRHIPFLLLSAAAANSVNTNHYNFYHRINCFSDNNNYTDTIVNKKNINTDLDINENNIILKNSWLKAIQVSCSSAGNELYSSILEVVNSCFGQKYLNSSLPHTDNNTKLLREESQKMPIMGGTGSKSKSSQQTSTIKNGLLLYYNEYSFYSQKVVMALHEKNLPFESNIINISKGEQFQQWFLQLNPRAEVPILQDMGKIIPDSGRIIDYLEDNFSNGDTPRLIPMDQGAEVRQKVTYFRKTIETLPMNVVTIGSFLHADLGQKPKIPFISPVRSTLIKIEENSSKHFRELAEKYEEYKKIFLQKAEDQDKKHAMISDRKQFLQLLETVDQVLDKVEEELSKHTDGSWWLCTDRFTVADIALAIVLERLYELGLEQRFWTGPQKHRPHIEKYFQRLRERDSYQKTIPGKWFFVQSILLSSGQNPLVLGVGVAAAAIALVMGGMYLFKRLIY